MPWCPRAGPASSSTSCPGPLTCLQGASPVPQGPRSASSATHTRGNGCDQRAEGPHGGVGGGSVSPGRARGSWGCGTSPRTPLTSLLLKYFRAPSRSVSTNFRLKNCPLSRPRFQRKPSRYPGGRAWLGGCPDGGPGGRTPVQGPAPRGWGAPERLQTAGRPLPFPGWAGGMWRPRALWAWGWWRPNTQTQRQGGVRDARRGLGQEPGVPGEPALTSRPGVCHVA